MMNCALFNAIDTKIVKLCINNMAKTKTITIFGDAIHGST